MGAGHPWPVPAEPAGHRVADAALAPAEADQTAIGQLPVELLPADDEGDEARYAELRQYCQPGISRRHLRDALRAYPGQLHTLDLHGLDVPRAHFCLTRFLQLAMQRQWRVVEVVHGRGCHSQYGFAILKAKTRKWLSQSPVVLGFREPTNNPGALHLLLAHRARIGGNP